MPHPTELLRSRYGDNFFAPDIEWNDSLTTLLSYRSIRAYLPNSLPEGTLELLVAAAQSAATSSNLQTWSVVALSEQDKAISHYNEVMKAFYTEQQMNVTGDWAEHSSKRVATPSSLTGRDRLREALNNLGFELR